MIQNLLILGFLVWDIGYSQLRELMYVFKIIRKTTDLAELQTLQLFTVQFPLRAACANGIPIHDRSCGLSPGSPVSSCLQNWDVFGSIKNTPHPGEMGSCCVKKVDVTI